MEENKKNKSNIIIIIIILIALILLIFLKNNILKEKPKELTPEQKISVEIDQAAKQNNLEEINSNIDNIKIEDTTEKDMQSIDKELETL